MALFPDAGTMSLNRVVAFTEKTDGRDKVIKALKNFLGILVWRYAVLGQTELAKKYKKLASALSECRTILKFGKPLKAIKEIREIGSPCDIGDSLEITTNAFDIVYKLGDNLEFLSEYKFLSYDPARLESMSKVAQFWCYSTQIVIDIIDWRHATEAKTRDEVVLAKLRLKMLKDFCDFLRVAPPFLKRFNRSVPTHDGFAALMGTVSGLAGVYSVWLKTK